MTPLFDVEPRVSIVIPCRNEGRHIEMCLRSMLIQEVPPGGFEVIVADGMSDDGTREILARLAAAFRNLLVVVDNPAQIVSAGLNAAIRAARGTIIVRMDAHTEYAPDYVSRCVEILASTQAENVGGPARTRAESLLGRAIAAAYHSPFAAGGARFHDVSYEGYVDTVTYGCWRRQSFEQFGFFDEELVRNQDDEHNLRIIRGGGRIYQSPRIKSWYRPRSSLGTLFTQYMQYGYWKVRVIQKHQAPAAWRHLVPGAFVLGLLGLFLLSSLSMLLTTVTPNSPWIALSLPVSIFGRHVSAFTLTLVVALGAYFAAVGGASLLTAAKTEWKLLPLLPLVFPCYHFGYGYGFLRGIGSFLLFRRRSSTSFTQLTRGATEERRPRTNH